MLITIVTIALVFGTIMGAREAVLYAQGTGTVEDARKTGLFAGMIFAALAFAVMLVLWGIGAAYWWLLTL